MPRPRSAADPDDVWPDDRHRRFKETTPAPPAARPAPRQPSIAQRGSRIAPFRAKDGYINIFGLNPFDKEPADD